VETLNGADTNTTDLSNPIQNAIDFADTNGLGTVEVEPGTYDESVTVDVPGLTVAGPNAGTPGDTVRGAEAVITGGSGNTPGVQIAADNVTLDGLQVENTDTNGIRFGPDTVPSNVTIQNSVVTNVTGAIGGKSAGNGIQFQFSNVANETAQNIQILDNEISNITTPNATSAETIATGVNVLPRGNNVSLEIRGNTFTDIEPGTSTNNRAEARGVSLSTQDDNENGFGRVDGAVVTNNTFDNISAGTNVRAVSLFEEDDLNPREGVKNFTVTRNNFTSLSGATPGRTGALFVGGYETLGADHVVTGNNFDSGGVLRFTNASQIGPGFDPSAAEDLNAMENWWGNQSGPSGAGPGVGNPVSENVTFDPWLDAPFPAGQPVTDGDIDVRDYVADNETVAGGTLNASATVENALQDVTANQGRALTVEHVLLANGNRIVLNSTSVDVVPGTTETVSFVNSPIPDSVSGDSDAEHRIQVRGEFVSQNLVIESTGSVAFNDQVLGTNASGSDAVRVEDVSTSDDATVVVTYENNAGDLVVAGLTEIQSNSPNSEDVTVVIEDTGGFPGEHVAHLIPTSDLSTNYSAGDTVSNATAGAIVDNDAATVFDGSVNITDQTFQDNTSQVTVDTSDLQPETVSDYRIVVHNQTGVSAGDVGPALGSSGDLTGTVNNVTVDISEITQTTDLLAMIHFPSGGTAIPTLDGTDFGIGDGQAGTVTDTATASIVTGQVAITDSPTTVNRTENLNGQVNATVTAQEVTTSNTASIEATLVFEGVTGEGETVLGSETVDLGPDDSTTVTFDNLNPIPNATIASDGSVNLRVETGSGSDSNATSLSHSVQNAVDFAVADSQGTVDLLAGTFVEEVTIDTDNATIGGTGTGSTTIDGNVTLSGDNNTLEEFTIDGNLTITGANNDISNITVTGQVTQNSVGTTQLPNSGVVIVQNDTTLTDVTSDAIVVQNNSNADVSNSSTETLETETGSNTSISNSNVNAVEGGGDVSSGTDAVEVRDQNGNLTAVFNTIGAGVDNAPTNGRLVVASGTYEESVTVGVEGLTLEAAEDASPTIDISADSRTNIPADNVTVSGFSVVFEGQAAYIRGDNVTVEDNTFELESGTTSTGYALRYEGLTSDGEVRNNEFVGITNNQSGEFGNGVIIAGADGHEVVENTFDGNSIGVNVGKMMPAGELLVSDNTFTSQDDFAVALNHDDSESPNITVSSNNFDSNPTGVLVLAGGDISVSDNAFTGDSDTVYVSDTVGALTLSDVLNNEGNTFDPDGEVVGDQIRVEGTAPTDTVVNLDTDTTFDTISAAENAADPGETLRVGAGTFEESVTINTDGLTLEGPNAGIAGDSDQRGDEASFQTGGNIDADNVTIDGFELVPGPNAGNGQSRTEILGSNAVITNSDVDVSDGDAPLRLSASANHTVITQNQFASGDGGNFVINARQDETNLIDGVEITDNTFEDITGTGTSAIQANGYTNANISGNSFDNIGEDAVRLAGNVSGTEVTNNEFSNYAQDSNIGGGQFDAGAVVAVSVSGDVDISGNQFNDAGGDNVYVNPIVRNDPAALDLNAITGNNTFNQGVEVNNGQIVPSSE
jgi:hypothetical protein